MAVEVGEAMGDRVETVVQVALVVEGSSMAAFHPCSPGTGCSGRSKRYTTPHRWIGMPPTLGRSHWNTTPPPSDPSRWAC